MNRENGNSFSNDAQPESITLSSDETKAYVALQVINILIASRENLSLRSGVGF